MRYFKRAAFYLLWGSILCALPARSVIAAGPMDGIHYDKTTDALTVHVHEMPLGEILRKIGEKSGIKFSILADVDRLVTTDITAVPLDKGIYSLVQPDSSAMIYSKKEDGTVVLTSVKIFDKRGAAAASSEPPRRFNGPGDPSVYGGADRAARSNAGPTLAGGTDRGSRSHQDAEIILPDSDSEAGSTAQTALERFSTGIMRRDR